MEYLSWAPGLERWEMCESQTEKGNRSSRGQEHWASVNSVCLWFRETGRSGQRGQNDCCLLYPSTCLSPQLRRGDKVPRTTRGYSYCDACLFQSLRALRHQDWVLGRAGFLGALYITGRNSQDGSTPVFTPGLQRPQRTAQGQGSGKARSCTAH